MGPLTLPRPSPGRVPGGRGIPRPAPRSWQQPTRTPPVRFTRFPLLGPLLAAFLCVTILACSDDAETPPDFEAPAAITNLTAGFVRADSVALRWTAPGDDGTRGQAAGYEVRFARRILTEANFDSTGTVIAEPPAQIAGASESLTVGGLGGPGRVWFALRTRDEIPNWSGVSNILRVEIPVGDTIPPAAITTLGTTGFPGATSVTLTWIAPGDDDDDGQAHHYEIRQHGERFDEDAWDSTGVLVAEPPAGEAGSIESLRIDGLAPETVYYFGIRTYDESGNRSLISNQPPIRTASLDPTPPAAADDLRARLDGLYDVVLTWTATADDGRTGAPAFAYDLRSAASMEALEDWANAERVAVSPPSAPGTTDTARLVGLPARTRYAFALEILDDSGNRSARSNVVVITTSDSSCVVRPDSTGDYPTIGAALALGGGCDIVLEGGVYRGAGNGDWPASATRRIRSATGDPGDCVVDFEGRAVTFPPALAVTGITFRNAARVLLQAADTSGFVLAAESCAFDGMAFDSEQPVERGPVARFVDCEFRRGTVSPLLDLGEIEALRCDFLQNRARLAIAYRSEWIDCVFSENAAPSGALLRSFNDLQGPNRFLVRGCRFLGNESPMLSPQNGLLEVEDCLFSRNLESCVFLVGASTARIVGSTFVRNERSAGSCLRSDDRQPTVEILRSILVGNEVGPILDLGFDFTLSVACTDVYGNERGDWSGPLQGLDGANGNLSLDPLFCAWADDDYRLRPESPCAPAQQPECGRSGAFDPDCQP